MKLLTKNLTRKLQAQFPKGSDFDQNVVVKFFDPTGSWTWYAMNQDPNDPSYLWGIVKGHETEMGSFSLTELAAITVGFGLGIERDLHFRPRPAREVWEALQRGEHV